tara:strand:+ start:1907 stop:3193 length:1287 start_codon:yes stop_codon:yes gene_type:complete
LNQKFRYPPATLSWFIWCLGAVFFLLAFFHRVAPGVLGQQFIYDFSLNATTLGILSSLYFYSYVAMQIPTGILVDKIGPRKLIIYGGIVAFIGTLFLSFASTFYWAGIGRFLIGGSVAVAFVSTLKLTASWLQPKYYSLSAGFLLVAGMIGAIIAGVPLQLLSEIYGWRLIFAWSSLLGLVISLIAFIALTDDPTEKGYLSFQSRIPKKVPQSILLQLRTIIRYRNAWLMTLAPGGLTGIVLTFSGLWGVPFLVDVYLLSPRIAAAICSGVMLAWAISGPFFSLCSERLAWRKRPYLIGSLSALICWSVIFLIPELPLPILLFLLFFAGFSSGGMILGFALAKESVPIHLSGTVTGLVNTGVMCGPMLLQPLAGAVLDQVWDGRMVSDIRTYDFVAYRAGFSVLLIWLAISVILLMLARESNCRQIFD